MGLEIAFCTVVYVARTPMISFQLFSSILECIFRMNKHVVDTGPMEKQNRTTKQNGVYPTYTSPFGFRKDTPPHTTFRVDHAPPCHRKFFIETEIAPMGEQHPKKVYYIQMQSKENLEVDLPFAYPFMTRVETSYLHSTRPVRRGKQPQLQTLYLTS